MNDAVAPDWTIITVTRDSAQALMRFWGNRKIPSTVEWIVVDNSSHDNSAEISRSLGAKVCQLSRNIGFSWANNIGFSRAAGRFVLFANPDVAVDFDDLTLLSDQLKLNPRALVAPQLLNTDGSPQPNGRGLPYIGSKIAHRLCPSRVSGSYAKFAQPNEILQVDWLMGAAIAGTRAWLSRVGPWDSRYFLYYEDHVIGLTNGAMGGAAFVVGTIQWKHGWARETGSLSLVPWIRELASMMRFYWRYPQYLRLNASGHRR